MNKTKLQELCHQFAWNLPEYAAKKDGPDHNPCFTATVIVNGVSFESPKDQCRSSKEAQNLAAHIAYDHFTATKSVLPSPNMLPSSSGMLHLYKNRLQQHALKQNITLPVYSSELDGPPHARRFRSKVTVEGKTYETQEFFSTLKEAENAAAKVALDSLALNDIQEDEGLYKTLLQQLAQKEGLLFPVYDTAGTGPPHAPIFCSVVKVGGGTLQGQEAKTKKQAEMNAAKVAYNALVKRRASQIDLPDVNLKSVLGVASSSSQSPIKDNAKQAIRANEVETSAKRRRHTDWSVNKGGQLYEPLKVVPASSGCAAADVSQAVVQQKTKLIIEELNLQNEGADTNAKRHRCSTAPNTYSPIRACSAPNTYSPIRDPCPAAPSSASAVFHHSTDSIAESADSGTYAGTSVLASEKIFIFPRNANMELPNGASGLPCSNEKWVAAG